MKNLTIIIGPPASGKTRLLDLIKSGRHGKNFMILMGNKEEIHQKLMRELGNIDIGLVVADEVTDLEVVGLLSLAADRHKDITFVVASQDLTWFETLSSHNIIELA